MFHRYDPPPVPVKVVEVPDVIVTSSPLFAVGPGFIPTITVEVAVQPLVVSVTVTVTLTVTLNYLEMTNKGLL